jgi:hypothetical protein
MRSKISRRTTRRISSSSISTKDVGTDAWMVEQGFRETTTEEHRKFSKFFPAENRTSAARIAGQVKRVSERLGR